MEKKVILLTGASGGLGRELARLLKNDYRLALHFNTGEKELEENADCYYFQADLREESQIKKMVDQVILHFGQIDVLINNAGVSHSAMTWKTESDAWKNTLAINLDAPFYLSKAVIPHLRKQKGGSIVNISSVVAQTGYIGTSAYAASKAGLIGLTKSLSKELAHFQINANVLALGYFNKGMIEEVPETQLDEIVNQIPLNRLGEPNLIAKTIVWLTSEEGAYVTGQTINLNGDFIHRFFINLTMFQLLPQSNTPRWVIILIDLVISAIALGFAYVIRFDLKADEEMIRLEWLILSRSLAVFFVVKAIVFYSFSIHKGLVRHTSTADMKRIFFAVTLCSIIFLALGFVRAFYFDGYFLFPTSVLLIEFLASFVLMIGLRFTIKLLYLESIKNKDEDERILIYGAGISGLITKRTIEKDIRISYKIIGFIDDNKKLDGTRLEGLKIYNSNKLESLIKEEGVTQVIVAIQNPLEKNKHDVLETCIRNDVKVQKVPSPKAWINGEFSAKQIGKIQIEDLLGRDPIVLSEDKIKAQITGKTILVSGAAGSIGSGLVKQLLEHEPKKIILLDQAESPMYDLNNELNSVSRVSELEVVIGDIRNKKRMERLFAYAKLDIVYHAAAYKHVPLMENNPSEAIKTNVEGTRNLVDCSMEFGVGKFVMISTDKAVNPTNVMGASKRISEMYAQLCNQKGKTKFITTRFGNVLGSNGSVIPLFQKQIEQGGPITLTDERITRFFMTIPEACQLVLEAGAMGEGGEIFVFDMGESVKIIDLAKKMIILNGLELGKDIEIKVTGLRPGEKLYEELLSSGEDTLPTHHPLILKAKVRDIEDHFLENINTLIHMFGAQDNNQIVALMKKIVPEYVSNNSEFEKLDKK